MLISEYCLNLAAFDAFSGGGSFFLLTRWIWLSPRQFDGGGMLLLSGLAEGRVMSLCNLHAGVAKQQRNLIERHACEQQLHREGIAEHMRVASFRYAIGLLDVRQLVELPVGPLEPLRGAARIAVARPEEVGRVGVRQRRSASPTSSGMTTLTGIPVFAPGPAANVGAIYADLYRELTEGSHAAPTFKDAVRIHRLLAAMETAASTGQRQQV